MLALKQQQEEAANTMGSSQPRNGSTLAPATETKKKKTKKKRKKKKEEDSSPEGETLAEAGDGEQKISEIEEAAADDGDDGEEQNDEIRRAELKQKISQLLSNAQRLKPGFSQYPPRYSLGIDFGDARTGVAVSKGFAPRPVEVVELRGQKLDARLIDIADRERAIEFIVGLPKSSTGLETPQSSKTRCFAGRLAVLAAQRGWSVYLHDEFGSSDDALEYMLMMGSTRKGRKLQLDAYAAVILLQTYFDNLGKHAELVVPKKLSLQQRLCEGPIVPDSDDDGDFEDEEEQL